VAAFDAYIWQGLLIGVLKVLSMKLFKIAVWLNIHYKNKLEAGEKCKFSMGYHDVFE
jgi:hypothetical protein